MGNYINEKLMPLAGRVAQNKYLMAISNGFMTLMPVLIVGSIFSLLNGLSIPAYQQFITNTGLKTIFSIPNGVTNDMLALYTAFFVASSLAKLNKKDESVAGMISLFSFLAITPLGSMTKSINSFLDANAIVLPEGVSASGGAFLPMDWIGAKGLFVAIFVGLISSVIYSVVLDKGLAIKMPASVPPTISKSFAGLIPGFVSILFFIIIDKLIGLIPIDGVNGLHSGIYSLIQGPMEVFLGNNIWSMLIAILAAQLLWCLGIHGMSAIILPIFYPLWTSLTNANLDAIANGISAYDLPNIINRSFWQVYVIVGGSGATIGLCLCMMFLAKSKQYKTLGGLSIAANLCGINEPIIFGTPIVLNPVLAIPFILTPMVSSILAYILTVIGILPRVASIIPLGTPVFLSGFLSTTDGAWRVVVFQAVIILIGLLIYLPFFRIIDKQAYDLEAAETKTN